MHLPLVNAMDNQTNLERWDRLRREVWCNGAFSVNEASLTRHLESMAANKSWRDRVVPCGIFYCLSCQSPWIKSINYVLNTQQYLQS
jgi:hypothetical protein